MMEEKRIRLSLTIRCQPTKDKPFANIVNWLNGMPIKERRKTVQEVCMMSLLPYALEASDKTEQEVERCYWEVHERVNQYLFTMRQVLGIKTSNSFDSYLRGTNIDIDRSVDSPKEQVNEEKNELQEISFSDVDSFFGVID